MVRNDFLQLQAKSRAQVMALQALSLIHISEPTRLLSISYAVFCLKKKKLTTGHRHPSPYVRCKTEYHISYTSVAAR